MSHQIHISYVSEVSSCFTEVQEKGYQSFDQVFKGVYVCVYVFLCILAPFWGK